MQIFLPMAAMSPLILLASVCTPANAAVAYPSGAAAPQATNCHGEDFLSDFFDSGTEGGFWYDSSSTAGSLVVDNNTSGSEWCHVAGMSSSWELLRKQGTSLCATYAGPATGPGEVRLEACNSTEASDNWQTQTVGTKIIAYTNFSAGVCLSANKFASGKTQTGLIMVNPTGGCDGNGGQNWVGF